MRYLAALVLASLASIARAGPVDDAFGDGILGMPWGATEAAIAERFPDGKWRAPTSLIRGYSIRDNRPVLGVTRSKRDTIWFGLSSDGRLRTVQITFPTDHRTYADLLQRMREQFGAVEPSSDIADPEAFPSVSSFSTKWPRDNGIDVNLVMGITTVGSTLLLTIENTNIRADASTGLE